MVGGDSAAEDCPDCPDGESASDCPVAGPPAGPPAGSLARFESEEAEREALNRPFRYPDFFWLPMCAILEFS